MGNIIQANESPVANPKQVNISCVSRLKIFYPDFPVEQFPVAHEPFFKSIDFFVEILLKISVILIFLVLPILPKIKSGVVTKIALLTFLILFCMLCFICYFLLSFFLRIFTYCLELFLKSTITKTIFSSQI